MAVAACSWAVSAADKQDEPVFVAPDSTPAEPAPLPASARKNIAPAIAPDDETGDKVPDPERKTPVENKPAENKPADSKPVETAKDEAKKDAAPAAQAAAAQGEQKITLKASDVFPDAPKAEQDILDLVRKGIGPQGRAFLKNRKAQPILAGQAVLKGIERNLVIQRQERQEEIVRWVREEARALFDPVLTLTFNHSFHVQYNRMADVLTFQRPSVQDAQGNNIVDLGDTATPQLPIKNEIFSSPRPAGKKVKENIASDKDLNGPVQTEQPAFRIDQQLPWGPAVFVALSSKKSRTFFDDGPASSIELRREQLKSLQEALKQQIRIQNPGKTDTDLTAQFDAIVDPATGALLVDELDAAGRAFDQSTRRGVSTGKPWSSSISGGFVTGIPGTKDFGPYAQTDTNLKVANLNRDKAYWDTATVVNATLAGIDFAYWDVVGAMQNLWAVTENRQRTETIQSAVKQQLDLQRTTKYGMLQVESQLAAVKQAEEQAWIDLLQTSNALANLLDESKEAILLPAGYTKALGEEIQWTPEAAYSLATEHRPELRSQRLGGEVSEVLLRFARNQVQPDLKYGLNLTFSQNARPFGYESWGQSLGSLFLGDQRPGKHWVETTVVDGATAANLNDVKMVQKANETGGPDNRIISHSLVYNWPFRNRFFKAALMVAEANRDQQDLLIQSTERQVEEDVGDALAAMMSTKQQLELAREAQLLAQTSYNGAKDLLAAGRMTEFEITSRLSDVLNADIAAIQAAIAYKKSQTLLLQAEGILPNAYPGLRAVGELEDMRLNALRSRNTLRFFKPINVAVSPIGTVAVEVPAADAPPAQTPAAPAPAAQ
jgi:outer membrane protein TolC